jgi:GH25 family lysozyme M1 (1,4-beta-N-acetylmuramidase)
MTENSINVRTMTGSNIIAGQARVVGNVSASGSLNQVEQQNLAQAAAEIQQLLEQLEKSYPANTTTGKMQIATEAISQIDSNPPLAARILSALKAGGVSAFEQLLNHPAASFVIGALQDWQETKKGS